MEKSIESIWKEGFLSSNELIAPKVNNLYDRKSIHLIEKFEKMFSKNIKGILIGSSILFIASYFAGAILAGSILLMMMSYVAYIAHQDLKALQKVDKGQSSYDFLKSFNDWISFSINRYGKLYRILYPALILTFYFGLWYSDLFIDVRSKMIENTDDVFLGLHIYSTLIVFAGAILMSIFSKVIHKTDVKIVYGNVLKKLNQTISDMEQLRS